MLRKGHYLLLQKHHHRLQSEQMRFLEQLRIFEISGFEVGFVVDVGIWEVMGLVVEFEIDSIVDLDVFGGMIGDWVKDMKGAFNCSE